MPNKKNIVIIILMSLGIAILVLVIGFLCYQRAEEEGGNMSTDWKTYRNEEYGFEIDYPMVGWEFKEGELCLKSELSENKVRFCIHMDIEFLIPACYDKSWYEIFKEAGNTETGGCIGNRVWGGEFKKEVTTDFGVKGYVGEMIELSYSDKGCSSEVIVYFPLKDEVELLNSKVLSLFALSYYNCPDVFACSRREIETFNQVVSTFRFIEE